MIEIIMLSIMMMQIEQPELPWLTPVSISVEFCDDEWDCLSEFPILTKEEADYLYNNGEGQEYPFEEVIENG